MVLAGVQRHGERCEGRARGLHGRVAATVVDRVQAVGVGVDRNVDRTDLDVFGHDRALRRVGEVLLQLVGGEQGDAVVGDGGTSLFLIHG